MKQRSKINGYRSSSANFLSFIYCLNDFKAIVTKVMRISRQLFVSSYLQVTTLHSDKQLNYNGIYHYTFKLHSRSLFVNVLQLIFNVWQMWRHFCRMLSIIGRRCPSKIMDADDDTTSKRAKITK